MSLFKIHLLVASYLPPHSTLLPPFQKLPLKRASHIGVVARDYQAELIKEDLWTCKLTFLYSGVKRSKGDQQKNSCREVPTTIVMFPWAIIYFFFGILLGIIMAPGVAGRVYMAAIQLTALSEQREATNFSWSKEPKRCVAWFNQGNPQPPVLLSPSITGLPHMTNMWGWLDE